MSRCFPRRVLKCAVAAVALSPALSTLAAPPSGSNYKLVFDDEFNSRTLDTMKWGYNYPWGSHEHTSQAYMDPSQVLLTGANLDLQAVAVRNPGATDFNDPNFGWQVVNYTSGCINTSGKFNATTGYFEASIKMPQVTGTWPAFWMLQGGWPPEVDIVEYLNGGAGSASNKQDHVTFHYTNTSGAASSYGNTYTASSDLAAGFHTYGVAWTTTSMNFYLDSTVVRTVTDATAIAQASNMYMLLENQVGGWAGTPAANSAFPADMLVDYVRVYQVNSSSATSTAWQGNAASGSWDTASNWTTQVPKYQDVTAVFGSNSFSGTVTVGWSNYRTVGGVTFNGNGSYVVGTTGGLTLSTSTGGPQVLVTSANTAPQTIAAKLDLEYSATNNTLVENDSAQTLTISGVIAGGGDLTFEGTGTTVLSNVNTYDGNTYVDAGTQGPAVVRATRSRPFGATGTVFFNAAGNATSGRIEVQDNVEVPNNIQLSGRNNGTVALENLSGTNAFSGTLSILVGGGAYLIQSDAGLMVFSAASSNAARGTSLTSLASGTRTVTFQGAGDGLVSGAITNGAASALGITKLGAGTWTFSGANTYSGPTTVSAGTLKLGSPTALGSTSSGTTVAAGAALDLNGQSIAEPLSLAGTLLNSSASPAALSADLTATAAFTVSATGAITLGNVLAPGQPFTKSGPGTLTVGGAFSTGAMVISGGSLVLAVPATSAQPSVTATFTTVTISAGASLVLPAVARPTVGQRLVVLNSINLTGNLGSVDLGNGDLLVRGLSETLVRSLVGAWYHAGLRDGRGLGSSLAGRGPGPDALASLAVITDDDGTGNPLYSTFDGVAATRGNVLVKYTYLGDANLDGVVDASGLAAYLAGASGGLAGWLNGDFNYDNTVNSADLALLLASLQGQTVPFGAPGTTAGAVPEPTLAMLLPAAALRRRRQSR